MIRTTEWKLVHTPGREINELYHLTTDPWELHNVYARERDGPIVADLLRRLHDWRRPLAYRGDHRGATNPLRTGAEQ